MSILHKKSKYLFLFFLISMLLLGTCYENTQTDSALMYGVLHEEEHMLCSSSRIRTLSEQLCAESTVRMLCGNAFLRQESARGSRTVRENSFFLLLAEFLLLISPLLFAYALIRKRRLIISRDVIVEYIHHKDGKKNN